MPMISDPKEAWRLICFMFLYQDERTGRVPGMMTYTSPPMGGMQPAFQGFALDYLFRKVGDDFITAEDAETMYPRMAAWAEYWITYRSAGFGDDVIALLSPHESGWDDASLFKDGFPTVDPCANAFLVLLMEAVARLAKKSRSYADKCAVDARAKRLTDTLVREYWMEKNSCKLRGSRWIRSAWRIIAVNTRMRSRRISLKGRRKDQRRRPFSDGNRLGRSMRSNLRLLDFVVCGRRRSVNMILTVGLQRPKTAGSGDVASRFCDMQAARATYSVMRRTTIISTTAQEPISRFRPIPPTVGPGAPGAPTAA
jgi:hypothetical protein